MKTRMKTKAGMLVLALMMIIPLLAACRPGLVRLPEQGRWEEDIFTSEYLGIRFILPPGWITHTGDDPVTPDPYAETRIEMLTSSLTTGATVQIIYETYFGRALSSDRLFETAIEGVESFGGSTTILPGTTEIGSFDWYSMSTEMPMLGSIGYGRQYFSASDGIIRFIIITYFDQTESADDIMQWFIGIHDPMPEPPPLPASPEVGDEDQDIDDEDLWTDPEL